MKTKKGFTLIESVAQLRRAAFWIDGSSISANFPFRADSLTLRPHPATGVGYGVTTSREGKPAVMVDHGLDLRHSLETGSQRISGHLRRNAQATRSQSERQGKRAGRRTTNDRKHRKVTPGGYSGQSRGRFRVARTCSMDEACYAWGRRWEDAPMRPGGVKGGGMRGKSRHVNSGENLQGSAGRRIRAGIRRIVESRAEALQGVGDGHSTEDLRDTKTFREGRAISLEGPSLEEVPA